LTRYCRGELVRRVVIEGQTAATVTTRPLAMASSRDRSGCGCDAGVDVSAAATTIAAVIQS
jgi:hypothetical protein